MQPARSSNGISKEYQECSAKEQRRRDAWSSKVEGKTHKTQAWFPPCLPATWACVRMCVCVKVHTSRSIASRVILLSLSPSIAISSHLLLLNLLPNRHSARFITTTLRPSSNPRHLLRILLIHTRTPLQQTLLDRTARLPVRNGRGQSSTTGTTSGRNASPTVLAIGSARVGNLLREVRDGVG